jgi:hypothetical protein
MPTIPVWPKHRKRLAKGANYSEKGLFDRTGNHLELVQGHAHGNVCVLDHLHELFEADLAVPVLIGLHDGFVDNLAHVNVLLYSLSSVSTYLLQLLVFQVAANHHLQHYEELAVADEAIAVNVVYAESEP